jgi:hypothetical protein
LNQALVEWSLDGPLPKLFLVIPTSNQDGRQAKNRKKELIYLQYWQSSWMKSRGVTRYFECWLTKDHFSSSFLAEDFNAIFFLKISITGINRHFIKDHICHSTENRNFLTFFILKVKMSSYLNCSRITMNSSIFLPFFSGKFVLLLIETILEGGHPRTIPPKLGSNWPSGFRGVD